MKSNANCIGIHSINRLYTYSESRRWVLRLSILAMFLRMVLERNNFQRAKHVKEPGSSSLRSPLVLTCVQYFSIGKGHILMFVQQGSDLILFHQVNLDNCWWIRPTKAYLIVGTVSSIQESRTMLSAA